MMTRVCLGSLKSGFNRLGSDDISPCERKGAAGVLGILVVVGGESSSSSSVRSMIPLSVSKTIVKALGLVREG